LGRKLRRLSHRDGLARNSDLFAAGVDMHGVHDWPTDNWDGKNIPAD